jgi:hypothetical protein
MKKFQTIYEFKRECNSDLGILQISPVHCDKAAIIIDKLNPKHRGNAMFWGLFLVCDSSYVCDLAVTLENNGIDFDILG